MGGRAGGGAAEVAAEGVPQANNSPGLSNG